MPAELELFDDVGRGGKELQVRAEKKKVKKTGSGHRPKKLEKGAKVKTDKKTGEKYIVGPAVPAPAPQNIELETGRGDAISIAGNTVDIPCMTCRHVLKITGHADTLLKKKCPKCGSENKILVRRRGNAIELQQLGREGVELCPCCNPKFCCFSVDISRGICCSIQ